jgi:hypothetical protein
MFLILSATERSGNGYRKYSGEEKRRRFFSLNSGNGRVVFSSFSRPAREIKIVAGRGGPIVENHMMEKTHRLPRAL